MKVQNSTLSFRRQFTPIEKIEARAYATEAKKELGLENLAIVTHSVSFPSAKSEDMGIGLLSLNQGAKSYVDFLYDGAIDTLSIEPLGIIKKEFYSPYDGTLLSKKPIADLKLLTQDCWANILEMDDFNSVVQNKDYNVSVPLSTKCDEYKTVEFDKDMVLYDYVLASQDKALRKAYDNFLKRIEQNNPTVLKINDEFLQFKKDNDYFLRGDAIYSILSEQNQQKPFKEWQNPLHRTLFDYSDSNFSIEEKKREQARLEKEYAKEIDFYEFCQFVVDKQQKEIVEYASRIGQIRYEKDLATINEAYNREEISKEKAQYLKSKIKEYKDKNQGVNIIGDKPVGYSDTDIFSNPSVFTKDDFMGAPPNLLRGSSGQDWDFNYIPYEKMFDKQGNLLEGGVFLKKTIKKAFKDNPGGIRIDHIIGLIDPWTYQKKSNDCISGSKASLFLTTQLAELTKCGITTEKISDIDDIEGAISGENIAQYKKLKQKGEIDFQKAQDVLNNKKEFLDEIKTLNVLEGSRSIFNYLLENDLSDLKKLGLNSRTIKGVIDPIKGIFVEDSLDRKMLCRSGVVDFEKAKEIVLSKKNEIDRVYSNVVENIILASAKEVLIERNLKSGITMSDDELRQRAISLIMCEDLGSLTMPVKAVMKKYKLNGMRNAARSNPFDKTHIHREINENERGNFWTISTHDSSSYKNIFQSFSPELQDAHINYVACEMNLDKEELSNKNNLYKYIQAKVARLFAGDKNPITPNNVMLNWLDIFGVNKQYNTPGLYDKTKNWVLRIIDSSQDFQKKYFEQTLPNKQGVDILNSLSLALKACNSGTDRSDLVAELDKLSAIAGLPKGLAEEIPQGYTIHDLVALAQDDKNLRGIGANSKVYNIPCVENYVLKVLNKKDPNGVKLGEFSDDVNLGQPVWVDDKNPYIMILKKVEGSEHSIPAWSDTIWDRALLKPKNVTYNQAQIYFDSVSKLAAMPQEAYDKLAKKVKILSDSGYKIDSINPNNLIVDEDEIHIIDYFKVKPSERNVYQNCSFDIVAIMLDFTLLPEYFEKMSQNQQEQFLKNAKSIFEKVQLSARNSGLSTDVETYKTYINETSKWFVTTSAFDDDGKEHIRLYDYRANDFLNWLNLL